MPYKNAQWAVTEYGVEAIKDAPIRNTFTSTYEIDALRLLEITTRGSTEFYDWPVHLAEKNWVDIDLFIDAFLVALEVHKAKLREQIDLAKLAASFRFARKEAREMIEGEKESSGKFRFTRREDL
jgi:hypothetical protein